MSKVETIYDHNPTQAELEAIGCDSETREVHIAFCEKTGNDWGSLYFLFHHRGDKKNLKRVRPNYMPMAEEFERGSYML